MSYKTKNSPTVSVIIPTYNRAHLISRAIKSVLNQTYQNFEIIVVDDGSTDNTEEIVKRFKDERIRYIHHKKNRGAAAARNTGIKASRAKHIAFQDSDDEWLPKKLEKQMEIFENVERKVGVVYSGFWRIEGGKKIYFPSSNLYSIIKQKDGDIHEEILEGNFVALGTAVVRKECFQVSGMFDEQLASRHDWELWIRISKDWHFKFIDEPLVIVYWTPDSISVTQKVALTGWKPILEKHFEKFKKNRRILAKYYFDIGATFSLLNSKEPCKGRKYFFKSIRTWPLILVNIKHLPIMFIPLLGPSLYVNHMKLMKLYNKIRKRSNKSI